MGEYIVVTSRLILRPWRDDDAARMADICSDPRVMEFLGPAQSFDDVRAMIARQQAHQAKLGHCFWVLQRRDTRLVIGFCGLQPGPTGTPIENMTEIGWRLAFDHWGFGYAREAARASVAWAWKHLSDERVWAITVPGNTRSATLMRRIGMARHDDLDFEHPRVQDGSPLKSHMTYSVARPR